MSSEFNENDIINEAEIGQIAPDFKAVAVVNGQFKDVSLSDYKGKYVVLFFYPLDFTFVCPTEITGFNDRYSDFKSLDTEILGVSVDSQFSHLKWIQTPRNEGGLGKLDYPLISDLTKEISYKYGVLMNDSISTRGLFIIDGQGIVQHVTINNLPVGRNVDETLRLISAFKHVQENPNEVCPMNWTPGDKTMNPDPEKSQDFFKDIK